MTALGSWFRRPSACARNASVRNVWGLTYLHPSNFAWLLKKSYAAIKQKSDGSTVVVSGGLFGSDLSSPPRTRFSEGRSSTASPGHPAGGSSRLRRHLGSGSGYLCLTYGAGTASAGWPKPYPLDDVGQHFYIDETQPTIPAKVTAFVQDVRRAYVAYEGAATTKRTQVTQLADNFGGRFGVRLVSYSGGGRRLPA